MTCGLSIVLYTGCIEVEEASDLDGCNRERHSCNILGSRCDTSSVRRTCYWLRETESFSYCYRAHDADVQLRYQSICVRSAERKIQEKDVADDTFTFLCNKSWCYVRATGWTTGQLEAFQWHSKTNWVKGRRQFPGKMYYDSISRVLVLIIIFIRKISFIQSKILKTHFRMKGLCNSPRFDKEAWQFENGLLTPVLWSPCLINVKRKCFLTKKNQLS